MKHCRWQSRSPTRSKSPIRIGTLLRRCLEKDRYRRLADAADVRLEIEDALAPQEIDSYSPPRGRSRRPWFTAALVVVLLTGISSDRTVAQPISRGAALREVEEAAAVCDDAGMQMTPLCDVELRYTTFESIDFGAGGQLYGTMEGTASGERLRGTLRLTNLAPRRPDNVNMPTLRGVLDANDGAKIYVEMNGIATLRESDKARVFVTTFTFRTADARYAWLNTTFGVLEGVLDSVGLGGVARGRAYGCEATLPR